MKVQMILQRFFQSTKMNKKPKQPQKTWVGLYPRKTKTKAEKIKSVENKYKKKYSYE